MIQGFLKNFQVHFIEDFFSIKLKALQFNYFIDYHQYEILKMPLKRILNIELPVRGTSVPHYCTDIQKC